jgi:hypothetical protein
MPSSTIVGEQDRHDRFRTLDANSAHCIDPALVPASIARARDRQQSGGADSEGMECFAHSFHHVPVTKS